MSPPIQRRLLACSFAFAIAVLLAGHGRAQGLPPLLVPPGNPITTAKANLGKTLFWDEQISATGTMACATCHMPAHGGADPRTASSVHPGADGRFGTPDDVHGSPGIVAQDASGAYLRVEPFPMRVQVGSRKAPPVINAAYNPLQFWDGRAGPTFLDPLTNQVVLAQGASLESQSMAPPLNEVEMAHTGTTWSEVAARVGAARPLALATGIPAALAAWLGTRSYPELFQEAFGTPDVTPSRIGMAIATYERTLLAGQAPIDAFQGGNQNALTAQEQRGLQIFNQQGRCVTCHGGPLFAQPGTFFNVGVRPASEDRGRAAITGAPVDEGAFKIASLRNVGLRAPYFHNGSKATLGDVVDFYARGGDFHQNQTPRIQPFPLPPNDRAALVAFLQNALTDPRVAAEQPPFDHPTLWSEGAFVPVGYGSGAAGSGAFTPRLVALEPPVLGSRTFTLGVADGLGGAPAALLLDVQPDTTGRMVLGVPLQVGATALLQVLSLQTLHDSGAGRGYQSLELLLPAKASLQGVAFYLQAIVADAGAAQGVAATAGARVTLFAPR